MAKIVRTQSKVTGGITPEEKSHMDDHAKLWIARAMRTTPIEPDKIVPAIKGIYAAAGLKEPRVVIVPSPLVMAFAYGASAAIWHNQRGSAPKAARSATHSATRSATDLATRSATDSATRSATDSATDSATHSATDSATRSATDSATHSATDSATRSATYSATRSATDLATRSATDSATDSATHSATHSATYSASRDSENDAAKACFEIAGPFGLECAKRWSYNYQGGNMWAGYESYLTAFRDILGLRLKEHENYSHWEQAAIHGGFRVLHPEFCIVSDFPEFIKVDVENRPHCENGPSHLWRDGWSLYHWHGVKIPAEWIEDKKSLTASMALTWENIEQRRAACELVGWNSILTELKAKTIDKDEDPEIGELVEVSIPDVGKERFLRVMCGTGRAFALPVPPTMETALQANAWTFDLDGDVLRKLEVRT